MNRDEYIKEKKDIEDYFSEIIKTRFKNYVGENYEIDLCADYDTHERINNILRHDGFEVYGMSVNMDGFELQLDFGIDYMQVDDFPFTRLTVMFANDGEYSVSLNDDAFSGEWEVTAEDIFHRYTSMTTQQLQDVIKGIKQTHLAYLLKMQN